VKRTVGTIVGLATVGVAVYVGSRLMAQPAQNAYAGHPAGAASAKTRVALLNLKYVVMNYGKWKNFTEQLKSEYSKYEEQVKAMTNKMDGYKKQLAVTTDQTAKEQIEKEAKSLQRQMQDLADEAKATLGKKESDMLVIIYREVASAVASYAQAMDIDLVMHYNDAITESEMNSPPNIQRKMVTGPCTPLYYKANEIDISATILTMLNQHYQANAAPAGTGAAAAPTH
jgi:Skp family chaperone for outer membrane proteins